MAATARLAVFYGNDAANRAPDELLMDRGGMPSSPSRFPKIWMLPAGAILAMLAGAALPAAAQTVVGNPTRPSVTVDLGVLDSLGPEPTLPDVLRGRAPPPNAAAPQRRASNKGLALHPPRAKKKGDSKPKTEPELAAHPAAPIKPVGPDSTTTTRDNVAATPLAEPAPGAAEAAAAKPPEAAALTPGGAMPLAPSAAPATPPPAAATSTAAPVKPAAAPVTPTAAPPSAPPTVAPPSSTTLAAMNTPPNLPPVSPVKPTPAAAPATTLPSGEPARILFTGAGADLPDGARSALDAVVQRLGSDEHLRLQLVAYASGTADQANQARRVSLQRALAVRSYLMERGIPNTRMDVRALGNHTEGSDPPDRVDIVMLEH